MKDEDGEPQIMKGMANSQSEATDPSSLEMQAALKTHTQFAQYARDTCKAYGSGRQISQLKRKGGNPRRVRRRWKIGFPRAARFMPHHLSVILLLWFLAIRAKDRFIAQARAHCGGAMTLALRCAKYPIASGGAQSIGSFTTAHYT